MIVKSSGEISYLICEDITKNNNNLKKKCKSGKSESECSWKTFKL